MKNIIHEYNTKEHIVLRIDDIDIPESYYIYFNSSTYYLEKPIIRHCHFEESIIDLIINYLLKNEVIELANDNNFKLTNTIKLECI